MGGYMSAEEGQGPPVALLLIIPLAFVSILVGLLFLFREHVKVLFARKVAEAEAEPQEPYAFALRYTSTKERPYRVCLGVRLHSSGTYSGGGGHTARTGLTCHYWVRVAGNVVADEVVGHGSNAPRPFDRHISTTYASTTISDGSSYTKKGYILLTELTPCAAGAEIVVKGTCKLADGTDATLLNIFLKR